jgi:hypothetical protein
MALRVVGAGLGRTGTLSLKLALAQLLDAPCYHMVEVMRRASDVSMWHAAARGETVDWEQLFSGYAASVDWPAAAHWRAVTRAYPDALVLLSSRPADAWWRSADLTIFRELRAAPPTHPPEAVAWRAMIDDMLATTFGASVSDREGSIAAFERHNDAVRSEIPAERLLEWTPGDGWEPLCHALGVPVPADPFPHVNTSAEWERRRRAAEER